MITYVLVGISFVQAQCPDCGLNGNCVQTGTGDYKCACKLGFLGSRCQLSDFCPNRPCGSNGACFPILRNITISSATIEQVTYYCQCYLGYAGFNCQESKFLFYYYLCLNKKN